MIRCRAVSQEFYFSFPASTSKGDLQSRTSWFLLLYHEGILGIGECAPMPGFSIDWREDYAQLLQELCAKISHLDTINISCIPSLLGQDTPSIRFGLETAILDLQNGGVRRICENPFYNGEQSIDINGLVWMSTISGMREQIEEKVEAGFNCLKLKVGSRLVPFEEELKLLAWIRRNWSEAELTIRLDANCAFPEASALEQLKAISDFGISSIEQPLVVGSKRLAELCEQTPIPIALDEELTQLRLSEESTLDSKCSFLQRIKPQAIVLKPSLLGGIEICNQWISAAESLGVKWWVTSFLESNVGLNSIAQFTAGVNKSGMVHGLGTGAIYRNNIPSPLRVSKGKIFIGRGDSWDLSAIL